MKRLLAVSWEMPPMYGPRATQVARTLGALAELGWESTVVCLDPKRGGPNWRDAADCRLPGGVHPLRVKSPEEWAIVRAAWKVFPWLRDRPDSKWVWIDRAASAATAAASRERFDGLVSFAQPWSDHLIGLRAHRATGLPWVAHFSDPWIDSPYWRGSAAQRSAARKAEEDVIRSASAVVFVAEEAAQLVMRKYPEAWRRKVAIVPHGFEMAVGVRSTSNAAGLPLRMVYTGRFYDGLRTPVSFVQALAALNREEPLAGVVDVRFVGPFVTGFATQAHALGLDGIVEFSGRVSRTEAESIARSADVLLVIDAPADWPSPFLPSKLVDYLPLRKPIFGITPRDGASASLLRRVGGFIASPEDEEDIRRVVKELIRRRRDGALDVGPDFDRVSAEYSIARTAAVFNDVLWRTFAGS